MEDHSRGRLRVHVRPVVLTETVVLISMGAFTGGLSWGPRRAEPRLWICGPQKEAGRDTLVRSRCKPDAVRSMKVVEAGQSREFDR